MRVCVYMHECVSHLHEYIFKTSEVLTASTDWVINVRESTSCDSLNTFSRWLQLNIYAWSKIGFSMKVKILITIVLYWLFHCIFYICKIQTMTNINWIIITFFIYIVTTSFLLLDCELHKNERSILVLFLILP